MSTTTTTANSVAPSVCYVVSDNNARETADTIQQALSIVEEWYDWLDGAPEFPSDEEITTLDQLCDAINQWHDRIAEFQGHSDFAGHGNYSVSAADQAGLSLTVEAENVLGQYAFATDGESGTIEATDFADAKRQLDEMFSEDTLADGSWGWVQDTDGYRYTVGQ